MKTMTPSQKAVKRLLEDLDDRKGFELGMVEKEVMRDWRKRWAAIIDKEFAQAECHANGVHLFLPKANQ